MTVSVVIVNYRTPELTVRAVTSAVADGASQVVVVDNASGDDSIARLRPLANSHVEVVESARNGGFGSGANLGAGRATGDVIVFLNSDAAPRPGSLASMAGAVADDDGRAIVGPRLRGPDGEIQRSAGLVPRPDDLIVRGLGLHHIARVLGRWPGAGYLLSRSRIASEYDTAIAAAAPVDVTMVSGACMAVGRSAFTELGGFDERYFMYFEDADLCRRAAGAGWRIRYLPDCEVDHLGGASSSGDYRFGPWHAASMVRYLRAWHGPPGVAVALGILWLRAVGHALTLRPGTRRAVDALRAGGAAALRGT